MNSLTPVKLAIVMVALLSQTELLTYAQDRQRDRAPQKPPLQKPPLMIAPTIPVGVLKQSRPAGKRGIACDTRDPFILAVLGPDVIAEGTEFASPRLFWYISTALAQDCEATFTLMCDGRDQSQAEVCRPDAKPAEVKLSRPEGPGIQEIDLAKFGDKAPPVELRPGVHYRWFVSVGRSADGRSKDNLDGAFIERVSPSSSLRKPWYDRLASAYDTYTPADGRGLAALLKDVGFAVATDR